jgi:hypothetical protein
LSPKARMLELVFGIRPFDRHDWVVDVSYHFVLVYRTGFLSTNLAVRQGSDIHHRLLRVAFVRVSVCFHIPQKAHGEMCLFILNFIQLTGSTSMRAQPDFPDSTTARVWHGKSTSAARAFGSRCCVPFFILLFGAPRQLKAHPITINKNRTVGYKKLRMRWITVFSHSFTCRSGRAKSAGAITVDSENSSSRSCKLCQIKHETHARTQRPTSARRVCSAGSVVTSAICTRRSVASMSDSKTAELSSCTNLRLEVAVDGTVTKIR